MIHVVFVCDITGQTVVEKIFSSIGRATMFVESVIQTSGTSFELKYNNDSCKRWYSNGAKIEIRSYNCRLNDYIFVLSFTNNRGNVYVENLFENMAIAVRYVKGSPKYSKKRFVLKSNSDTRKSWRSENLKIDITRFQIE